MDFLPAAFDALASVSQFIVYKLSPSKNRPGKTDKLPANWRNGNIANAHNPEIWLSATDAIAQAKRLGVGHGVGFVFTDNDPFWFLDIDDCLEPSGKEWSPLALSLLSAFSGAAVEVSASGRGLHIIGSGQAPAHGCRNSAYGIEFYTTERFAALTGVHAMGSAAFDATDRLPWLVDNYFKSVETGSTPVVTSGWTDTPCEGWKGNTDDDELLERALRSAPASVKLGNEGVVFRDLWEANADVLARYYPDPTGARSYDESAADAALAQRLAFWTGNDCERMRRLMQVSALNREKWERDDYLPRTILGACGRQKEWLYDKPPQNTPDFGGNQSRPTIGCPRATDIEGNTFLTTEQQKDTLVGCVYVTDDHRVLVPGGHLLNPERFNALYGGFTYILDKTNARTTHKAFDALTQSQAVKHNRVNTSCFRPDHAPASILYEGGESLVNCYWPIETPRQKGDVSRFLIHMEKLFPDPRDKEIMLAYLAAIIQHKGVKFQWAPLIQGVEGNGKTFLTRCIAFAIGSRYSHFPKAAEIAGKFNGWLYMKIFIGVEDIYLHDNRFETMEALKPMITNERQEVEAKGIDKITRDICANFLINTNHKDGLIKTRSDRRFAPFYTPQQTLADLERDGMLGEYFTDLYYWASKCGGYAMIAEYLENYPIPDMFNPAGSCGRAPDTSSTEDAINQGRSPIELEVLEIIDQDKPGFRGGWVSSIQFDSLLIKMQAGRKVPMNKRPEFMKNIGYVLHPALKDGRVNNNVLPDNGKPRLYIKLGHTSMYLTGASEVAKAYADAQKVLD